MMVEIVPQSKRPQRKIPWGVGFVTERNGRFQARWRKDEKWLARTFDYREQAEDWLRTRNRRNPVVPVLGPGEDNDGKIVYFVQPVDGGPIKIGHARDVEHRLIHLQLGSPVRLMVVAVVGGGLERERFLHQQFAHLRMHGEWFRPGESLLRWIFEYATTASENYLKMDTIPQNSRDNSDDDD